LRGKHGKLATVERLRKKGRSIEFEVLSWVTPQQVLEAFSRADLAIGKMKMGYYANAQIESMTMGVPTITYVRPELMTDELRRSGFIFSTLVDLEATLEHYLDHPQALAEKRAIARESVLRLHDNDRVTRQLAAVYEEVML
jgi:glycosyltransferase involved in cell wall biosynthesis